MSKETITLSREVETGVYCDKCGNGLCSQSEWSIDTDTNSPYIEVKVYPCEKCMEESFNDGKAEQD